MLRRAYFSASVQAKLAASVQAKIATAMQKVSRQFNYDSAKFIIIYLTIKQFVLFQISYPLTGYGSIYSEADVDNGCFVPFSFVKHF